MNDITVEDLIQPFLSFVQRKKRARQAKRWPVADAIVSRLTSEPDARGMRPVALYSYVLNGVTLHGMCVGFAIDDARLLKILLTNLNPQIALRVRYDPNDFRSSVVLNRDNPELLFKIDLDPHLMVMVD
jgi:hypothetical protein